MEDLISRQAAIDALDGEITVTGRENAEAIRSYVNLVSDRIDRLPSAQPEIIRCKDCKWYDLTHPYGTIVPYAFHCEVNDRFYEVSHFCGYGKRRESDGRSD